MQHRPATPASPRRSAPVDRPGYHLLLLLSLLLLVPACGGDAPAPDAPLDTPAAPASPTVDLTSVQTPEEELGEPEDPAPPAPPPTVTASTSKAPALDDATRKAATETLQPIHALLKDLLARYADGMQAKRKGDDAGWRATLGAAVTLGYEIQDRWNEVVAAMPANEEFDEEQAAAHHFPKDHSAVVDALDALRNIERQLSQ